MASPIVAAQPLPEPVLACSLRWRRNGHGSVSNHQPRHCLLNHLFGCRSKKTSKLRVTGLCAGNSPGTGEFPAQMASNAENVSIWWRHHVLIWPIETNSGDIWIKTQYFSCIKMLCICVAIDTSPKNLHQHDNSFEGSLVICRDSYTRPWNEHPQRPWISSYLSLCGIMCLGIRLLNHVGETYILNTGLHRTMEQSVLIWMFISSFQSSYSQDTIVRIPI